ncbi:PepSY-associated TM helix domain-containing protein [Stenotrophomonas sp. W1S232]|uniref:Membrane protein n=1 Tax=Stenotrophomonas koreensis TaxID=266128 RepID=A0A0R0BPF2_9GAMM|nr:PepSY-associated TM helix domain-containing protein [Stenotrophomonas koreensis]KRG58960.1 membrane protein [Stenotrophomonas koreensis]MBB1116162.1 PepSY-associated TM helix domain-containing protein [Stenotrophomonas koreensis]
MPATSSPSSNLNAANRGFWLRTLHQWHWISSAVCLVGMLLFAFTGITLNHASQIEGNARLTQRQLQLPDDQLQRLAGIDADKAPLPAATAAWLGRELGVSIGRREAEFSAGEVYLSLPGPGSDAWIAINTDDGQVEFEQTRRGAIAYLNDLHKGRNTGPAWGWFLDVFAVACVVFCLTGLLLLHLHARQRAMTWPLVGLGLVIPLLIALLLIH